MVDPKYTAEIFPNDAVKKRVLDNARWGRNFDYGKII